MNKEKNSSVVNWDLIEKVVYINLDRRPDRDRTLKEELAWLAIPQDKIIRFAAIEREPGYIGCTQSHLMVLKMAQEAGWKNILILEDDMAFMRDVENIERINHYFCQLNNIDWDVAFLAANYYRVELVKNEESFLFIHQSQLIRVRFAYCACAYLVNKHYYQKIIDNITSALERLERDGKQRDAVDAAWMPLMAEDNWLGLFPNFGYQKPDISDIQKGQMDYKYLFFKDLSEIEVK